MERTTETDEWWKSVEPLAKDLGYIKSKNLLYVFTAFVIGLTLSGVLFYLGWMGWLQSDIKQEVNLEPNITINEETKNTYDMDHKIFNENNVTVYVTNFVEGCP